MRTTFTRYWPLLPKPGRCLQIYPLLSGHYSANHPILRFPGFQSAHLSPFMGSIGRAAFTQQTPFFLKQTDCRLLQSVAKEPYIFAQPRRSGKISAPNQSHPRLASNRATGDKSQVFNGEKNKKFEADQEPRSSPVCQGHDDASLHGFSNPTSQQASKFLPSERLNRRSKLSTRVNSYMENMLNSIALLGQRLNSYTGTDYSGISVLRESIVSQENLVKSRHSKVNEAKAAHASALSAQSGSHREVVQLLERKHSWSDRDLEHYMALVRSEHTNEQAIQVAKDDLAEAERLLEEARVKLEKIERQQYHEEQIWSDTIRRNSTWVTFGLMGFNIILLLASLIAIEPWRRKRLAKEIRKALDDRPFVPPAALPTLHHDVLDSDVEPLVETPSSTSTSSPRETEANILATSVRPEPTSVQATETIALGSQHSILTAPQPLPKPQQPTMKSMFYTDSWSNTFALWKAYWVDLFSERRIIIARGDLTTATLEGAAAGAAMMGLMFVILRPR